MGAINTSGLNGEACNKRPIEARKLSCKLESVQRDVAVKAKYDHYEGRNMALMIHDTTGTQTDSARPLSRKKLKQLMWRNPRLTTANLQEKIGRRVGLSFFSKLNRKRQERANKRRLHSKRSLPDGTTFQLTPTAADLEVMKPTIFERLGSMFKNLRKRAERESVRKGA